MKHLTQTIEQLKYGYDPNEFFPIMENNELRNRQKFVAYKLRCIVFKRSLI